MISEKNHLNTFEKDWVITQLDFDDLEIISRYEKTAWPTPIQASSQTFLKRLEFGHFMLGIWRHQELIGLASWRRGWFNPIHKLDFPKMFDEFANVPNAEPYNAAFAYNLSIRPDQRGTEMTRALIMAVIDFAKQDHCYYLVGDGRCPSYNGSAMSTEHIAYSSQFRMAIDRQLEFGDTPTLEDYLTDPILRFYYRMLNCKFIWTMQDFIPRDIASGGHRVIFYKALP